MDNTDRRPNPRPHLEADLERRAFWNDRYASGAAWSGHVNPALAETAEQLPSGRALDLGCGEGGDVLWLAEHGWQATGIDAAPAALARAAAEAERRGVRSLVQFVEADLAAWSPAQRWDLVSCHYLHESDELRGAVLEAAVAAVAPGGTLLVVGHDPGEPEELQGPRRDTRFTAESVASLVAGRDGWSVSAATRPRTSQRQGVIIQRLDAVLVATAPRD